MESSVNLLSAFESVKRVIIGIPAPNPRHQTLKLRFRAMEYGMERLPASRRRVLNNDLPGVVPNHDKRSDSTNIQRKKNSALRTSVSDMPRKRARGTNIANKKPAATANRFRSNMRAQYLTHGRTCGTPLTVCSGDWVNGTGG